MDYCGDIVVVSRNSTPREFFKRAWKCSCTQRRAERPAKPRARLPKVAPPSRNAYAPHLRCALKAEVHGLHGRTLRALLYYGSGSVMGVCGGLLVFRPVVPTPVSANPLVVLTPRGGGRTQLSMALVT